jgi:hypothetical protein
VVADPFAPQDDSRWASKRSVLALPGVLPYHRGTRATELSSAAGVLKMRGKRKARAARARLPASSDEAKEEQMTTYAELAARLLRDAATMFRSMGGDDAELGQRVEEFAQVYDQVADLVESDPTGSIEMAEETPSF